MKNYDLIVIGSGPAGEKAAVKAAYFGKKVALIEKEEAFGGAGVNTGTLPSKTLKESALFYSGKTDQGKFGVNKTLSQGATIEHFMYRKDIVVKKQGQEVENNLKLHGVDIYKGIASFVDPHTITIDEKESIQGEYIIIATGTYPYHPEGIPFDGKRIHDSDTILNLTRFPKSLCIVGAGVIGCEYATIFSTMGTKVTLVNSSDVILPFIDHQISSALVDFMQKDGITIQFNTSVDGAIQAPTDDITPIKVPLKNGQVLEVDMFLFAAGRCGSTKALHLEKAGVTVGKRECLTVGPDYKTNVDNIYAVGDVIGFPALASTGMDQGRVAVAHIFNTGDLEHISTNLPYGIYTVPEVSMIGKTEEEMQKENIPYAVGIAHYRDMPRGQIMGIENGFLKVVFSKQDMIIRGVHIIGPMAAELIHYGLTLVENNKSLMQVIAAVFNFPTLHDLYKYACYDGLGNLKGHKVKK